MSSSDARTVFYVALATLLAAGLFVTVPAYASRATPGPDRSLAPHFVVEGDQSVVDGLPMKSTRADVQVAGVIARVRVTQTYKNEGKKPIEAKYVFPGSTRAAVFGMTMHVGTRKIKAKIEKREAARRIYEQAKQQGKTASLLEQQRPNVFEMNVANILPGDEIRVILDYTEALVPDGGTYEFVYPAVVGPRYTEMNKKTADGHSKFSNQPYTRAGKKAKYDWDVQLGIDAGMPIHGLASPSHRIQSHQEKQTTRVYLQDGSSGGDRDFVLRYSLRGDAVNSGLLLFPGEKENFFMTMVQPPKRVRKNAMPAREYIFVIDVSGSMHGFPLGVAKDVMNNLLKGLRRQDRFNIMTFSGGNRVLAPKSLAATPANVQRALNMMANVRGGGSTRLLPALKRALAMPASDDISRSFVVVTDGYVMVEAEAFQVIRENLGNANLFAFGIGSSVNRHLIEGMARVGMGESFVVLRNQDADKHAAKFQKYIASPALTNIKVAYRGFNAYDVEPASVPDLFAERPVMVFGKYRGKAKGRVVVTGTSGHGKFKKSIPVSSVKEDKNNNALRYLWARHRIAFLDDLNSRSASKERKEHVTELGLKYNLLTAYTSFVAVDDSVRNADGKSTTVTQPLPLPKGVSNRAVGGGSITFSGTGAGGGGSGYGRIHGLGAIGRGRAAPRPQLQGSLGSKSIRKTTRRLEEKTKAAEDKDDENNVKETTKALAPAGTQVTASGALTSQQAQAVLKRHQPFLTLCLERLRKRIGKRRGRVVLQLRVDGVGRVVSVKVRKGVATQRQVNDCLSGQLRRMHFPIASGDTIVTVTLQL